MKLTVSSTLSQLSNSDAFMSGSVQTNSSVYPRASRKVMANLQIEVLSLANQPFDSVMDDTCAELSVAAKSCLVFESDSSPAMIGLSS